MTSAPSTSVSAPEIEDVMLDSQGGPRLYARSWPASRTPRANVLVVHGPGEHIGRYEHVAAHPAARNYAVFGFDLRGHGRSTGKRAFIWRFEEYVEDLNAALFHFAARFGDLPVYLLGHSMGGLIVLRYALKPSPFVSGIIASSPFIVTSLPVSRPLLALSGVVSRFFPALPTVKIQGKPMTHDAQVAERASRDPLSYRGRVRARTGYEMREAGSELQQRASEIELPVYVFHGTEDYLADWRASLSLFGRVASQHRTLTLYRGFYHETLNESRRQLVLESMADWLDDHAAAP